MLTDNSYNVFTMQVLARNGVRMHSQQSADVCQQNADLIDKLKCISIVRLKQLFDKKDKALGELTFSDEQAIWACHYQRYFGELPSRQWQQSYQGLCADKLNTLLTEKAYPSTSKDFKLEIIQQDALLIQLLIEHVDEQVYFKASDSVQEITELAMLALNSGAKFSAMLPAVRGVKKVAQLAINIDANNLQYVTNNLHDDRDCVEQAFNISPVTIRFASPRLKKDEALFRQALFKKGQKKVCRLFDSSLLTNPRLLEALMSWPANLSLRQSRLACFAPIFADDTILKDIVEYRDADCRVEELKSWMKKYLKQDANKNNDFSKRENQIFAQKKVQQKPFDSEAMAMHGMFSLPFYAQENQPQTKQAGVAQSDSDSDVVELDLNEMDVFPMWLSWW